MERKGEFYLVCVVITRVQCGIHFLVACTRLYKALCRSVGWSRNAYGPVTLMVPCIRNYIRANGAQQRKREKERNKIAPKKSSDQSGEARRGGGLIHIGLTVEEEETVTLFIPSWKKQSLALICLYTY